MILLDSLSAVTIDLCKSTCVFHLRNLIEHIEIIYVFVAVEIVVLFILIRYGGRERRYVRRALDKSQGDLFDSSRICKEINKYAFKNLMGEIGYHTIFGKQGNITPGSQPSYPEPLPEGPVRLHT